MGNIIKVLRTDNKEIEVDISPEKCTPFGFLHNDHATEPHGNEVRMEGVGKNNKEEDVMYYEIIYQKTKGMVCHWGGEKNLLEAGFVKI